jgi:cardiolipin synthase
VAAGRPPPGAQAIDLGTSWAGNVTPLVDGAAFFPVMLESIAGARASVDVIQFGYRAGEVGTAFTDALAERARAGVAVRMVVDWAGCAMFRPANRELFDRLARAGAQVVVNNALHPYPLEGPLGGRRRRQLNRTGFLRSEHRKVWIIDGRIGYVGGAGVQDHFQTGEFHDVYVQFEGDVVRQLQYLFVASFLDHAGTIQGPPTGDDWFPEPAGTADPVPARVLLNAPGTRRRAITEALEAELAAATTTLDIMNPYVTEPSVVRALVAATTRGVQVRLIVPGRPNNKATAAAMRHHYPALLGSGVAIWEYPAVAHAKVIVRDRTSVLVGTLNLDALSLYRNHEVQLQFQHPAVGEAFTRDLFDADIERSARAVATRRLDARLVYRIAAAFSRFL